MIWGFRREVDENCALIQHYAEYAVNLLPTFRDNLSARFFMGAYNEDETDS